MTSTDPSISRDLFCPSCGYNLRGLSSNRCPECGEEFDPEKLAIANIPWLKRAVIGTWNAYWQTVFLVLFHPFRLANEIWNAQRIDPRAAVRFRRIILTQALVSAVIGVVALIYVRPRGSLLNFKELVVVVTVTTVILGAFLILATDVSIFFSPPPNSMDERLWRRTLAFYACAPLATAPVAAILVFVMNQVDQLDPLIQFAPLLAMMLWWECSTVAIMHVIHRSMLHSIWLSIILPLSWIVSAVAAILLGVFTASIMTGCANLLR